MKPGIGRAFSFWMVGALALVALMAPTSNAAAQGTGSVTAFARYCTGLAYQGPMTDVGSDCETGPASFTFYLHGDGTDDSWNLNVGDSGEATMDLKAGTYDVWTPGGPIFNITVPENGSTSFVYGFPVQAPPPPAPEPEPDPVIETATLNVSTYACTGITGAPIALGDVGPDCTPIATNLDFYLWGDGSDDSWNLTTSAEGSVAIELQVGGYEVVNTQTWETLGAQLPSGGGSLAIGYAAEAAPAPDPVPETATLNVTTYECTGVTGAPIALVDIGPDCTPIATNLDFYLWGDGSDDSWNLTTSAEGSVAIELQVGGYEVVNTQTWETLGAQLPSGGGSLAIGYAAEAAPAPDPVPETATLNVTTYECTGVTGAPIALVDIGPDCTPIATNLDFYLWGDGSDDSWNLTTSAEGSVAIELQVGGYEVVNTQTWETLGAQLPSGGGSLAIGYAAEAAPAPDPVPETATLNVTTYECTGVTGAPIALVDIGPDCTPIATNLDFYLWGDGSDDSWNLTTSAEGSVAIELQVGGYEVVNTQTWETLGAQLPSGGGSLAIGYAAIAPVETGTLNVSVYSCTGITDNAIVLNEIGPDCTRVAAGLDFYLWGDGTDQSWYVLTNADDVVSPELPVGDYVVVDTTTWLQVDATVVADVDNSLAIGIPATYLQSDVSVTP